MAVYRATWSYGAFMRNNPIWIRNCAAGALLAAFALVGCGSDEDDGGGDTAKTACMDYCDATAHCPDFLFTDSAECKSADCSMLDQATGTCATAFKNYYDCVNAKTDVCDETGCVLDLKACM